MLTWKEYKFVFFTYIILLSIFSFFLYEKIDFYYIILLMFATGGFIKSIYDIKNRTGSQSFYTDSDKDNQLMRYFTSFVGFCVFCVVLYVIFCNELQYCQN